MADVAKRPFGFQAWLGLFSGVAPRPSRRLRVWFPGGRSRGAGTVEQDPEQFALGRVESGGGIQVGLDVGDPVESFEGEAGLETGCPASAGRRGGTAPALPTRPARCLPRRSRPDLPARPESARGTRHG